MASKAKLVSSSRRGTFSRKEVRTAITEVSVGKVVVVKVGRDASTGRFITIKEAKRRPKTTIVETIRQNKKRK